MIAGNEAQKDQLLPRIARGEILISLALSEPEGTWDHKVFDQSGIKVSAKVDGDGYVINGVKLFVHDAHVANYLLVVTRTRARGITLFLVNSKSPGIKFELLKTLSGDHKQSEVTFQNVRVGKQDILGEFHRGWPVIDKVLKIGAVMLCAEMVGVE
jgi:alkylation response protein AidB-like acyl-CoA dehydrogenase